MPAFELYSFAMNGERDISSKRPACQRYLRFGLVLAVGYLIPIILVWLDVIPFRYRLTVFDIITILAVVYVFESDHTLRDLGFRTDNLIGSLKWNLLLIAVVLGGLAALRRFGVVPRAMFPGIKLSVIYYIIVLGPVQEFLFRSIIFAEMDRAGIRGAFAQITLSAALFSFLHVIYRDWITLVATFAIGIVWGAIYYKYRNFYGVALSHVLMGIAAISSGLILTNYQYMGSIAG